MKNKKIVIKVGSQAIISESGQVLESVMEDLVLQIVNLQRQGVQVILVSSGAVALGRIIAKEITGLTYSNSIADKQLMASFGQPRLMAIYTRLCAKYDIIASQILLTKYDFQTKRGYTNILRLLEHSIASPQVLTIINENDSVAIEELMFTDNDELSGIVAAQIGADKLILLTSIDGVYDGNPSNPESKLIPIINYKDTNVDTSGNKTSLGRGGMLSKLSTARKMASVGIMTHIAHVNEKNVLHRLVIDDEMLGSRVLPTTRKTSLKRYLAVGDVHSNAFIKINNGLLDTLLKSSTGCVSLLPVGIISCSGDFKKGDLVEIITQNNKKVGVGIAHYNQAKLEEYIGQQNKPYFIHYNYLYIDYVKISAGE